MSEEFTPQVALAVAQRALLFEWGRARPLRVPPRRGSLAARGRLDPTSTSGSPAPMSTGSVWPSTTQLLALAASVPRICQGTTAGGARPAAWPDLRPGAFGLAVYLGCREQSSGPCTVIPHPWRPTAQRRPAVAGPASGSIGPRCQRCPSVLDWCPGSISRVRAPEPVTAISPRGAPAPGSAMVATRTRRAVHGLLHHRPRTAVSLVSMPGLSVLSGKDRERSVEHRADPYRSPGQFHQLLLHVMLARWACPVRFGWK
jgi:hypothetical protein